MWNFETGTYAVTSKTGCGRREGQIALSGKIL
jgi:hypothetical protein